MMKSSGLTNQLAIYMKRLWVVVVQAGTFSVDYVLFSLRLYVRNSPSDRFVVILWDSEPKTLVSGPANFDKVREILKSLESTGPGYCCSFEDVNCAICDQISSAACEVHFCFFTSQDEGFAIDFSACPNVKCYTTEWWPARTSASSHDQPMFRGMIKLAQLEIKVDAYAYARPAPEFLPTSTSSLDNKLRALAVPNYRLVYEYGDTKFPATPALQSQFKLPSPDVPELDIIAFIKAPDPYLLRMPSFFFKPAGGVLFAAIYRALIKQNKGLLVRYSRGQIIELLFLRPVRISTGASRELGFISHTLPFRNDMSCLQFDNLPHTESPYDAIFDDMIDHYDTGPDSWNKSHALLVRNPLTDRSLQFCLDGAIKHDWQTEAWKQSLGTQFCQKYDFNMDWNSCQAEHLKEVHVVDTSMQLRALRIIRQQILSREKNSIEALKTVVYAPHLVVDQNASVADWSPAEGACDIDQTLSAILDKLHPRTFYYVHVYAERALESFHIVIPKNVLFCKVTVHIPDLKKHPKKWSQQVFVWPRNIY